MKLKNYSDRTLKEAGIGIAVEPGDTIEVADGYCRPLRAPNGSRIPSIIERVCPGLEPEDEKLRKEWKSAAEIDWLAKPTPPSAEEIQSKGVSPGIAAIMAEKAKVEAAKEAKAEPPKDDKPKPKKSSSKK